MLKVFDKAQWHIDAGEEPRSVLEKFDILFRFLYSKDFLTEEGKEIMDLGIDSSISLHERMLTDEGKFFLEAYYDKVINRDANDISKALDVEFSYYCEKKSY